MLKFFICWFCMNTKKYDENYIYQTCFKCRTKICKNCEVDIEIYEKYANHTDFQSMNNTGKVRFAWPETCPGCCEYEKDEIYQAIMKHDTEKIMVCTKSLINWLYHYMNWTHSPKDITEKLNKLISFYGFDLYDDDMEEEQMIVRKAMRELMNKEKN